MVLKIVWFINVLFPEMAEAMGKEKNVFGGWLQQFKKNLSNDAQIELIICSFDCVLKQIVHKKIGNTKYYVIPKREKEAHIYDSSIEVYIEKILSVEAPNLVHVWGTEYPHALSVSNVTNKLEIKTVYSIQGLISDCAKHFLNGLTFRDIYRFSFRDLIRFDNVFIQQKKFEKRGDFESQTLLNAENVIGRTYYDYSVVKEINPKINYYFCNECLRDSFYQSQWKLESIYTNTIFISQASYPIKGFHFFLDALRIVKEKFPEVKVYIAGGFTLYASSFREKIRMGSYAKCLKEKIENYGLESNVVFLGCLSEIEMKDTMLRSHVFVSPSLVENSSNSVGEAMLLGIPVVSSYVGGLRDMIEDKKSGLLYPVDQPSMMAQMIMQVFEDDNLARQLSKCAREQAKKLFSIQDNTMQMKNIYRQLVENVK